jgi:heme/copper-type cytochrome/quinol oxidase subunit 2
MHVVGCSLMSTRFLINAMDVLHSFAILGTGLKVDAIVGRVMI